jgi:hypothetical protein
LKIRQEIRMAKVSYHIVEHNGGWAYKVDDVFSETFADRAAATDAARRAAAEQGLGGEDEEIEFQDENGTWRVEHADGGDRRETEVDDA